MISEFFLNIIFTLVNGFFSVVPDFSWSVDTNGFQTFLQIVQSVGYLLPVKTVVTIIGLVISFMIFRIVVKIIIVIWDLLPFA